MKNQLSKMFSVRLPLSMAFIVTQMLFTISANAQISYTDIIPNMTVNINNGFYQLDLNNDGIADFKINYYKTLVTTLCNGLPAPNLDLLISITPLGANEVGASLFYTSPRPSALSFNAPIDSSSSIWQNTGIQMLSQKQWMCVTTPFPMGVAMWQDPSSGFWSSTSASVNKYLPLRLHAGSQLYYGWIHLNVASLTAGFTAYDYAYNTIPGQPILAGETSCVPPTVTLSPGNPVALCSGDSVQLNAMTNSVYLYRWFKDGNLITGADTSFHTINSAGAYNVEVGNSCGYTNSAIDTVVLNSLPTAMITSSGPTTFCQGGNVVLNATTGIGYTYQWVTGAGSISGATNSSYTAITSGTYRVVVTNTTNCSATSTPITVVASPLPTVTLFPGSSITLCNGESVQLIVWTTLVNYHQWFKDGNAIIGADTSFYTTSSPGAYYVEVGNSCGNANSAVATLSVFVNNISVTASGSTLTSNATNASYQWMDCSTLQIIPGATSQTFSPSQGGSFAVIVSENGCRDTSICYSVIPAGIYENISSSSVLLFPNPATNHVTIDLGYNNTKIAITINDMTGNVIYAKTAREAQKIEVNTKDFAEGVYVVQVQTDDFIATDKLVIEK